MSEPRAGGQEPRAGGLCSAPSPLKKWPTSVAAPRVKRGCHQDKEKKLNASFGKIKEPPDKGLSLELSVF